jgi:cytochrome c biogenesis protein CcmG, thiol:disulfide interchange protein DsbE
MVGVSACRGWGVAAAIAVAIVGAGCVAAHRAHAEPTRFLPWTETPTPALALHDLAGRRHALADYRGKVILINFWATWCEPCRDEMPSMQKLEERLRGQPFVILGVNYGEALSRVREFAERMRIGFSLLVDPNQDSANAWRVRILPASFLVARDGRARYRVIGEMDWASDEAVSVVRTLLR